MNLLNLDIPSHKFPSANDLLLHQSSPLTNMWGVRYGVYAGNKLHAVNKNPMVANSVQVEASTIYFVLSSVHKVFDINFVWVKKIKFLKPQPGPNAGTVYRWASANSRSTRLRERPPSPWR